MVSNALKNTKLIVSLVISGLQFIKLFIKILLKKVIIINKVNELIEVKDMISLF